MSDASDVRVQMRGPGDNGWAELAPQPDNNGTRYSYFSKRNVTAQTVVQALATVVFELTLRVDPRNYSYDKVKDNQRGKETNLGLSAIAAANSIESVEILRRVEAKLK